MIDKTLVKSFVEEWLDGKEYFLTDLVVTADDKIVVEIDHKEGVWIEDCVELSRFIESHLDRDETDFELEVGSAGIGQPFKVLQQYEIHLGEEVDVILLDGRKLIGVLYDAEPDKFTITVKEKVRIEGKKRPEIVDKQMTFSYDEVKATRLRIDFK